MFIAPSPLPTSAAKLSAASPLEPWLRHIETLHPLTMDFGLERVRAVAECMALKFEVPLFVVAGTNGKGSTCAMLESILSAAGYKVGLHTSPHLVRFNERCRIEQQQACDQDLVWALAEVEAARGAITLSYFEFSLLAFVKLFTARALDAVILEVGLGGRLDAVNIFDADCSVITSIDLDHMQFLGPDRESIGREKAGVMREARPCIVSDPMPPHSVIAYGQAIGADLWLVGRDFNYSGDKQQWAWSGRGARRAGLGYPALRGANQLVNASGVLAALEALRHKLPIAAQDVRNGLAFVELPGRFQIIPGTPTLVLDVAHNPHSVAALAANLDQMGFFPKSAAVFGAMADKDLGAMLRPVLPLFDHWYLTELPTPRAKPAAQLQSMLIALGVKPHEISVFADPSSALQAAFEASLTAQTTDSENNPTARITVFGSFYTVGGALEAGLPKPRALRG